jgi:hypothetical protein
VLDFCCSQHVPNCSFTLSHIICLKFYSCNLYKQPEEGDYNKFILGFCIAFISFVVMGQSKMPHNNRKLLGSRQLINMSHNMSQHEVCCTQCFFSWQFFLPKSEIRS